MKVHKSAALVAGAAALALALAACSSSGNSGSGTTTSPTGGAGTTSSSPPASSSSSTAPAASGTVIWGESTEWMTNLQPLIAAGNALSVENLEVRMFDGPERFTPNISYEYDPDQVTAAPVSKIVNGQQVVSFTINPKAVWDDGQPITEKDWAFTWQMERSANPKQGGCAALLSTTGWDQVKSVTGSGDNVAITFKKGETFPDWKSMLVSAPLSQHVYDQGSPAADCAYLSKGWPLKDGLPAGVTDGPWMLQSKNIDVANKAIELTPNPKYWGAPPKIANLIDKYIGSDTNTNVNAIKNGEVNVIYPQPELDLVKNLDALSSSVTNQIDFGVDFEHLDFNAKDPLLAHLQIRQAIAYAINRPALVNATVGQFSDKASVLGNRLLMSNQPGYQDHSGGYAHQNIAKAKQLLQSIGCTVGSGSTLTTCFGKPLQFAVETTTDNPLRDQTIQIIANQVKAIGVKLTEKATDDIFGDNTVPDSLVSEGFQLALFAWSGSPAISANKSIYISPKYGQQQNYTQAGTPQIDTALNKMATAPTTALELKYANQADQLLWGQMLTLPLYQKPTLLAFSNSIKGIADNATQAGPLWNSDQFTVAS